VLEESAAFQELPSCIKVAPAAGRVAVPAA
jgi:hypothetical protein